MAIRFSICVPNFNYGRYLGETLRSVLDQDYPHFEIIVADNASTDDSAAVVEAIQDPRVRLIRNRYNIGFSPNLDRATETAQYEHMILLSSDDLMRPGALARYAQVLDSFGEEASRCVLTSAVDLIDSEGKLTGVSWRAPGSLKYSELSLSELSGRDFAALPTEKTGGLDSLRAAILQKEPPASFLATCYPRRLYESVEGYHNGYRIFPDYAFLEKLLATDPLLIYVPDRLFAYRWHNQNQTNSDLRNGAIKYQIDAFHRTLELRQQDLDAVGVTRDEIRKIFVNRSLLDQGLGFTAQGLWLRALKCFAFAFATYPGTALRNAKTYALAALLALGPIGHLVAKGLLAMRKSRSASGSRDA